MKAHMGGLPIWGFQSGPLPFSGGGKPIPVGTATPPSPQLSKEEGELWETNETSTSFLIHPTSTMPQNLFSWFDTGISFVGLGLV